MSSAAHGRERGCATLGRVTNDDRERALAMTARRQDGCFTREQALANGHSAYGIRRAISTGRWTELLPDVLASSAAPASVATRERAALLWLGPQAALAEFSAARFHRLGVQEQREAAVWVAIPHGGRRLRSLVIAGGFRLHVHHTRHPEFQQVTDGRRVTGVARTLVDLGRFLDERDLAAAFLAAAQRGACSVEDVMVRAARVRGRAGSALAAAVAREFDPAFESILGAELHEAFRAGGISVASGVRLLLPSGETIKPDGYDEELRMLVKADGWAFHGSAQQIAADKARDRRALAAGLITVRYDTRMVRRETAAMLQDYRAIAARRAVDLRLARRLSAA